MRTYNKNRTFYRFRWFYDYSGGQLTNFGVHYLAPDPLGARASRPRRPSPPIGGKFADYDNREVPDTMEVVWHYPGDTLVTFSQFNAIGGRPGRPAVRDRVPRHQGDAVLPTPTATRSSPRWSRRTSSPPARRSTAAIEKGWRTGAKPHDRGEEGRRPDHGRRPRPQLPRLREEPQDAVRATSSSATACTTARADRQHRPPDAGRSWNGTRRRRRSSTTPTAEQAAELRVPQAVRLPGLGVAFRFWSGAGRKKESGVEPPHSTFGSAAVSTPLLLLSRGRPARRRYGDSKSAPDRDRLLRRNRLRGDLVGHAPSGRAGRPASGTGARAATSPR